jgi:hypothetical protein
VLKISVFASVVVSAYQRAGFDYVDLGFYHQGRTSRSRMVVSAARVCGRRRSRNQFPAQFLGLARLASKGWRSIRSSLTRRKA